MTQHRIPRVIAVVATAIVLALAGGAIVGAVVQHRAGGYLDGDMPRFHTSTAALVTDEVSVGARSAHPGDPDDTATIRLTVTEADPGARLFVGIGPKREVDRYLSGTSYDEFAGATYPPFHARFHRRPGSEAVAYPAKQQFWTVSSAGTGRQVITWTKPHGAWTLVAMNEDGSPGVTVHAKLGFHVPFAWIATGALILALVPLWFALGRPRPRRHTTRPDGDSDREYDGEYQAVG